MSTLREREQKDSTDILIPLGVGAAGGSIDEAEPPLPLHRPTGSGRLPKRQQLIIATVVFLSAVSFLLMMVWMYQIEMDLDFSPKSKPGPLDIKVKDTGDDVQVIKKPTKKLYTIVMPMIMKDIDRFKLFYYTYKKFFKEDGLAAFLIITRDEEMKKMTQAISEISGNSPIFRIVNDLMVVPELKKHGDTIGWMQQQILKLSAASFIETDFYLVLDADLVVVQPVGLENLFTTVSDAVIEGHTYKDHTLLPPKTMIDHGETAESMLEWDNDAITPIRSLTNMEPRQAPKGSRPDWYEGAEKFLDMPMDGDIKWVYGVTPAILATPIVLSMQKRLETLGEMKGSKNWRYWFFENLYVHSYTEYALYYVYAVGSGMFDKYHVPVENGMYQHHNSIWWKDSFRDIEKLLEDALRPNRLYEGAFMVIQSNTQVDVEEYRDKVIAAVEKSSPRNTLNNANNLTRIEQPVGQWSISRLPRLTILCGPSKTPIHAIKTILAICSEPFKKMFYGKFRESTENEVEIPDVDARVFRTLMRNLFTDEFVLDDTPPFQLLLAADKYILPEIASNARKAIKRSLSVENVLELVEMCTITGIVGEEMMQECKMFMQMHCSEILRLDSFPNCSEAVAMAVVSLNPIKADEIEVFNAVLRWTEAEIGRRGKPVERLEYHKMSPIWEEVRFQQISSRDLSTIVYESGIFTEHEHHNLLMHVNSGGAIPCEIECPMMRQRRNIGCCLMGYDHGRHGFDDVIDKVTKYESELQLSTVYLKKHAKDPIGSYDSVFYWQSGEFTDQQVFFRSLDRFVTAGGDLVVAVNGFSYGRMEETEHIPIIVGDYGDRTHLQMKQPPNEPDHPVMDGIKKIDGGNNDNYIRIQVKQGLDPAPVVLAYWDNDVPMAIAWDRPVKGRVVVLNFHPVSNARWRLGWPTTPDNDIPRLIHNALRWTARCSAQQAAEPPRKKTRK